MTQTLAIAAVVLSLAANARAKEPGPPPITKATLVGSWQAVSPYNPFVYRLEVAANAASYFVWTWDSHPIMCRLVSSDVQGGKVTLRFLPMRSNGLSFEDVTITAKGVGDATWGSLTGKLRIRMPMDEDYVENVGFVRPPWVAGLPKYVKKSEELLERARREKR